MANKTGGVSLGAINERRLRPIYDNLDNGNNKNALHEADKLLKKQRDLLAAKVLKTIALQRLGREDEAFNLSQEVAALEPTDENSLQGLSLYYREINRADLISPIYETAVKKCPGNEEYMTHLFMSYVRTERLKDMQRVAIILYKSHPKNPYLFWGIMAIVMQAQEDEKLGKLMFLPLAERMIEKHIEKGKIEADAEVRLYLMILQMLDKYEKCLEVLGRKNTLNFSVDLESLHPMKMEIYEKLEKWEKVNSENKKLMKQSPDVWNHVIGYLNSLEHLVDSGWKPSEEDEGGSNEDPDFTWEQGVNLILSLVEADKTTLKCRRGPFLARFEILARMKLKNDASEDFASTLSKIGNLTEMFMEYVELFSTKPCCFEDLRIYVKLLSETEKDEVLKQITEKETSFGDELEESSEDDKEEEKKIFQHLFLIKMQRFLGYHDSLSVEEKSNLVSKLIVRHEKGLEYSSYRPITDLRVVDDYCLLAANLMIDVFQERGDPDALWKAIYILELAKQRSPSNFKFNFTLIRLYDLVGVFMPCAQIYDSLDIKHMQQDSLGYIVCHSVSALGHYQLASQAFEASRAFFVSNNKDSLEFLISCFRNGTFHKVSEFVSFRQRVKNSLHSVLTLTEHTYMDLISQADIEVPYPELMQTCCLSETKTDFDILSDNRDFKITFDWQPESRQLTDSQIKTSFKLEKEWLRFRELQVRTMLAILHHTKQPGAVDETNNIDVSNLLDELEEVTEKSIKDPDVQFEFPFHGPPLSRIRTSVEINYQQTTVALLRLFQKMLNEINTKDHKDWRELLKTVTGGIEGALSHCTSGLGLPYVKSRSAKKIKPPNRLHHHGHGCHDDCHHDSACVLKSPEKNVDSALSLPVADALKQLKRNKLENLVLTCELFSISVLLVFNFKSLVSNVKTEAIKKRRRKKGKQEPLPPIVQFYQDFVNELQQLGQKVKAAVNQMESDAEVMTLDLSKMNNEKLLNGNSETVHEDITEPQGTPPTLTETTPLHEQIVQLASESIINSTNQLMHIVEGRLHNLKIIRI